MNYINNKHMKKLLEFQMKVSSISKDSENPFFKSKYFDINKLLEIIKPVLNEMEVVILQPLRNVEGRPALGTVLYDIKEDKILSDSTVTLPDLTDPQKMGSAITYYRRYSLQSLLGLEAEDDDGNLASNKVQPGTLGTGLVGAGNNKPKVEPTKKEIIARLCKKLGMEGDSAKSYEIFVFANTTHVLKESNYDLIIEKLENLIKNK